MHLDNFFHFGFARADCFALVLTLHRFVLDVFKPERSVVHVGGDGGDAVCDGRHCQEHPAVSGLWFFNGLESLSCVAGN